MGQSVYCLTQNYQLVKKLRYFNYVAKAIAVLLPLLFVSLLRVPAVQNNTDAFIALADLPSKQQYHACIFSLTISNTRRSVVMHWTRWYHHARHLGSLYLYTESAAALRPRTVRLDGSPLGAKKRPNADILAPMVQIHIRPLGHDALLRRLSQTRVSKLPTQCLVAHTLTTRQLLVSSK